MIVPLLLATIDAAIGWAVTASVRGSLALYLMALLVPAVDESPTIASLLRDPTDSWFSKMTPEERAEFGTPILRLDGRRLQAGTDFDSFELPTFTAGDRVFLMYDLPIDGEKVAADVAEFEALELSPIQRQIGLAYHVGFVAIRVTGPRRGHFDLHLLADSLSATHFNVESKHTLGEAEMVGTFEPVTIPETPGNWMIHFGFEPTINLSEHYFSAHDLETYPIRVVAAEENETDAAAEADAGEAAGD